MNSKNDSVKPNHPEFYNWNGRKYSYGIITLMHPKPVFG